MPKLKVLFLFEKWCDSNQYLGLSSHHHNLFGSLENSDLETDQKIIYFDDTNVHIDQRIENELNNFKPDIVVSHHIGNYAINPTHQTYHIIKTFGSKLVMTWGDTVGWSLPSIRSFYDISDLTISWACEPYDLIGNKHHQLWTPQDPLLYFNDEKKIDVSFIGTLRPDRSEIIDFLLENNILVNLGGGQRSNLLCKEDYAKLIRTSKMNINTSGGSEVPQMKGRVLETLASNSLLFEDDNSPASTRFTKDHHYVEFKNKFDLKDKIRYFLKNEKEATEIAQNGHNYFLENYSAKNYWSKIFQLLEI